jgi:hypothetical protein
MKEGLAMQGDDANTQRPEKENRKTERKQRIKGKQTETGSRNRNIRKRGGKSEERMGQAAAEDAGKALPRSQRQN